MTKNIDKDIDKKFKHDEYIKYYEPDKYCKSRSGDELIVANLNQWYLDYGNHEWKKKVKEQLSRMTLNDEVMKTFEESINWLDSWACSRTFGLGSKFPEEYEN